MVQADFELNCCNINFGNFLGCYSSQAVYSMDEVCKGKIWKVKPHCGKKQEDCWDAVAVFQARFKSRGWKSPSSVPGQI